MHVFVHACTHAFENLSIRQKLIVKWRHNCDAMYAPLFVDPVSDPMGICHTSTKIPQTKILSL